MELKVYDKAKWHFEADSMPEDLPNEAGATHIAFYLRWCVENDFLNKEFMEDIDLDKEEIENLKNAKTDLRKFFMNAMDGVLSSDELNTKGRKFSDAYYNSENTKFAKSYGYYLSDYDVMIDEELEKKYKNSAYYYIEYNEKNYKKIKEIIEKRYNEFLEFSKK